MELDYEYYNGQSDEHATSVEEEDIYETPCDDEEDYGPIYAKPPTEVDKIYEVLKGRNYLKLFHKDIKFVEYRYLQFCDNLLNMYTGLLSTLVLESLELSLIAYCPVWKVTRK